MDQLFTVLDSEVVDLRVCLQSADKELEELRMERKAEGRVHESRLMEHMQRVGTQHCMSEWGLGMRLQGI